MRKAIKTRHYEATGSAKGRVIARYDGQQAVALWRDEFTPLQNHQRAVTMLAMKCGLTGEWLVAEVPKGFVFVEETADRLDVIPWKK